MRRLRVALMGLSTLWGLGMTAANAGVVFSDNFDNGASPLWNVESGDWTASGGVYFSAAAADPGRTFLPSFVLGDFTIDVDINDIKDGGIWLRVAGSGGVLLVTGGWGGSGTGLYWHTYYDGDQSAPLNRVDGLFTPGVSDAHVRVVVSGDTYSAYVNGSDTAATTLETNLFSTGYVGLYDNSDQTFDNVVLSVPTPAVPEPASLLTAATGALGLLAHARRRRARRV